MPKGIAPDFIAGAEPETAAPGDVTLQNAYDRDDGKIDLDNSKPFELVDPDGDVVEGAAHDVLGIARGRVLYDKDGNPVIFQARMDVGGGNMLNFLSLLKNAGDFGAKLGLGNVETEPDIIALTTWNGVDLGSDDADTASGLRISVRDGAGGHRWNVDGSTGAMSCSTQAGITASTTQTQGQQPLVADVNQVATVANANDVVTLPAAAAGRRVVVVNDGANTLQVFPASGDDLGAGVNASTTVSAGGKAEFVAYDATNWVFF